MTTIAVDIETQGLDAQKFLFACSIKEGARKPKIWWNKKDLWNYIIDQGEKAYTRGKVLNVYSHNATYDFYGYADLNDPNITFFSHKPFIAGYTKTITQITQQQEKEIITERKKEIIKFLDTFALFGMSLQRVGEMIGLPKLETPEHLLWEDKKPTKKQLKEAIPYCIRDTELVLECLKFLRNKLRKDGVNIKRFYTINQIAIQYLITKLKEHPHNHHILRDQKRGKVHDTYRAEEIHQAYRGGRVECFKTGIIDNVTDIDINSLYPTATIQMRFPDLRSERKIWRPLEQIPIDQILQKIGLSKALIYNKDNDYGLLPVRTPNGSYYPKKNKYLIGVWTNQELQEAIKEGYEIIAIEWTVKYEDNDNPFKRITNELYKKRKESKTAFDNYFYKMMMNASYGKLAQTRTGQEIIIDNVEETRKYQQQGYQIMKGIGLNYLFKKTEVQAKRKPYYAPIIPCLITAWSRIHMYHQLKKIPLKDLIYTDTDNIVFKGNHLEKFKIGEDIGQFKIQDKGQKAIIWGRKTYKIGSNIKIAGIRKKGLDPEKFEKGFIESKRMITLNTTQDLKKVGKFTTEIRDLQEQLKNHKECEQMLEELDIYRDNNITDINYFLPYIEKITKHL